jgi:hypothetical protein
LIGSAYEEGGKILLDGRNPKVDGYPDGNWVGPTVIDDVKVGMSCYKNEIFGPVLCIIINIIIIISKYWIKKLVINMVTDVLYLLPAELVHENSSMRLK